MTPKTYKRPQDLKTALKAKQRERATAAGIPVQRVVMLDVFARFLARVVPELPVIVKGGVALELRLRRARTTVDVDLRAMGNPQQIVGRLREAGRRDLGDHLTFQIEPRREAETIEDATYDGFRFVVHALFANEQYQTFKLDVSFGDAIVGEPDHITAADALGFAGIPAPTIPIYPLGTHLAEKLHAYTLPRDNPNTRMKDLIDIALVAAESAMLPTSTRITASVVREAVEVTFTSRKKHGVPRSLPPPPTEWATRYPREKEEHGLAWDSIEEVFAAAATFLDPLLSGDASGDWHPGDRVWR